jgi:anti-sigma factor RsiW
VDPLVTPYVDGELAEADCARLDAHVRRCAPCQERLSAEQAVRALLRDERTALCRDRAPLALVARCREDAAARAAGVPLLTERTSPAAGVFAALRRQRLAPLAAAATIVIAAGIGIIYQATSASVRVLAAELTADHVKCALMNRVLGTGDDHEAGAPAGADAAAVERWLGSTFSWDARLPDQPEQAGLELVGSRQCLYGQGTAAHIMYRDIRHQGEMVSVFMIPGQTRTEALVAALGHEASVWSDGSRTFVLLAREPREDVQRLAAFITESIR